MRSRRNVRWIIRYRSRNSDTCFVFRNNESFRVFLILPLLPAFEGKIGSASTGNALRAILHHQYASLAPRGGANSLWGQLKKAGVDEPEKYVAFCSLRTHGELLGTPVTELVYVHSKLLIADDRVVICGSANVNDRSLLGDRDSEVALLLEDTEFDQRGVMDGKRVPSGLFAGSLRRQLMKEHLGLIGQADADVIVRDPVATSFYEDLWLATAKSNTRIFDDAFLVVPTDGVRTVEECQAYEQRTPLAEFDRLAARKMLESVKVNINININK